MPIRFLLHACCAPCSIAVIDELKSQFELTVFFYNPNIYPEAEYLKRKIEVIKVCQEWQVPMVDFDYETAKWDKETRGLENEPEMGARCPVCFNVRLKQAAKHAAKNGFDYFGTSLTSGRNKRADIISSIGRSWSGRYGVKFYDVDWKTDGRQEKARRMIEDRGIYRQNYCGCRFSLRT